MLELYRLNPKRIKSLGLPPIDGSAPPDRQLRSLSLYLQDLSLGQIKAYLESRGIKTVTGKETWDAKTIQRMLTNEKYNGDTMLQKNFTEDFMTGKKSKNFG